MQVEGKIRLILPQQSGTSKSTGNPWVKQEFVLDYFWWSNQRDASQMVFSIMGENLLKEADLHVNDEVKIEYHFEAHEYNGRWFNEVRCTRVTKIGASAREAEAKQAQPAQQAEQAPFPPQNNTYEDVIF